jgi:glycosyltransferase involved in cell wall biosynthesis
VTKNPPRVSVITIFLDAQKFLSDAVHSVFGQTFQDWELILVDDGSRDKSSQIARNYATDHPAKVRYIEHEGHQNLGMSASRNAGIRKACGEFIALLDADDEWFSNKLEEQIKIFDTHSDSTMVYGNNQFWKSWTGNPGDKDYQLDVGANVERVFYPPELLLLYFTPVKAATPVPSDLIFRREMALRHGCFEESFRNMYEEQPFVIKVFANEPVFVSSGCWTRYRQHEESYVAVWQRSGSGTTGIPPVLQWAEKYLREKGFLGSKVWQALQKKLFRFRHPFLFRILRKFGRLAPWPLGG